MICTPDNFWPIQEVERVTLDEVMVVFAPTREIRFTIGLNIWSGCSPVQDQWVVEQVMFALGLWMNQP